MNSMFLKGQHKARNVVPIVLKFMNLDSIYICPPLSHSGPSWIPVFQRTPVLRLGCSELASSASHCHL